MVFSPARHDWPQERQQAMAQSLVSLGNLATEHAEAESDATKQRALYGDALKYLNRAHEAYIKGFSASHPKVAWALEGLARVHRKRGELREAEGRMSEAIEIRRALAASDTDKQMFKKELEKAEEAADEIAKRRTAVRSRLKLQVKLALVGKLSKGEAEQGGS